jgi:hypothetical protein
MTIQTPQFDPQFDPQNDPQNDPRNNPQINSSGSIFQDYSGESLYLTFSLNIKPQPS